MTPAWAQRQDEGFNGGVVSPDVFDPMVDRLGDVAVPCRNANDPSTPHAQDGARGNVHPRFPTSLSIRLLGLLPFRMG
jgi:hypothetical protein